jgi:ferrous iron transport protein A
MRPGQTGIVVEVRGGRGIVARLNAMGIRPGVLISKQTAQLFGGPVVVRVGATQLALGFGVAQRIMVKVSR